MHRFHFVRPLMVVVFALTLAGCGSRQNSADAMKKTPPSASMIGEPCLVRVFSGKVSYIHLTDAFSPNEETAPKPGRRFIAIGFPIGAKQTLAVDDYEIEFGATDDDSRIPFAVGGENPVAPNVFYDPEVFAETVELTQAAEERNGLSSQSNDEPPLLVSWSTLATVLLLLYEIPADAKTVTLHHGTRTFQLQPDSGLIDGKPGAEK